MPPSNGFSPGSLTQFQLLTVEQKVSSPSAKLGYMTSRFESSYLGFITLEPLNDILVLAATCRHTSAAAAIRICRYVAIRPSPVYRISSRTVWDFSRPIVVCDDLTLFWDFL
ncbi:hypothetical protein J6590_028164 [Homalodisca vitripennis]|nr:hypothetical protein J6590_028164 [Homalodisca vitripennis]